MEPPPLPASQQTTLLDVQPSWFRSSRGRNKCASLLHLLYAEAENWHLNNSRLCTWKTNLKCETRQRRASLCSSYYSFVFFVSSHPRCNNLCELTVKYCLGHTNDGWTWLPNECRSLRTHYFWPTSSSSNLKKVELVDFIVSRVAFCSLQAWWCWASEPKVPPHSSDTLPRRTAGAFSKVSVIRRTKWSNV